MSVVTDTLGDFAYLPSHRIAFRFTTATDVFKVEKPTSLTIAQAMGAGTSEIAPWGTDNLYPQAVVKIIKENNTLSNGFSKRFRAVFANNIVTKKWTKDADGNDILVRARFPEFETFQRNNGYGKSYTYQAIRDLLRFYCAFPEFVLSGDKAEIVAIKAQKAVNCRWALQDTDGYIKQCFINAQWDLKKSDDETTKVLDVIYEEFAAVELFKERVASLDASNFIYPVQLPADENYYPWAEWMSIITSDWLDVNNNEPKFVKFLVENKATVNYIIKIKDWYWAARYPDWSTIDTTEKTARKRKLIQEFNDMMTGIEKSGKTMIIDVLTGLTGAIKDFTKQSEAWEITTVPQNNFDGSLKEDSNTARMEIMFAIDLDPSTFGSTPQQNRQGGSDKQQSYNIGLTMDELFRQYIVGPYYFIRDYNGWSPDMEFDFELPVMQTLANMKPEDRQIKPQQ